MIIRAKAALVAIIALSASPIAAETRVTLAPANQVLNVGDTPQFRVRLQALGSPARIIRFAGRDDLRITYARLVVTAGGKAHALVPFISDPGPIDDRNILTLQPGQSVDFQHRGEPFPLRELAPGVYSAKVVVDSTLVGGARVESNAVKLEVKAK